MNAKRFPWGHLTALTVWMLVFAGAYLGFDHYQQSKVAVASVESIAKGEIVIPRSSDGHYYVTGAINGQAVDFMVDTGATTVSVDTDFARRAGLPSGRPEQFRTAGGVVMGEVVHGLTVEAGGIRVHGLRVVVGIKTGLGEPALLGANFLRYVDLILSDDKMILRVKRAE
ncbi:MAG: TIGR02281 family clan AA aspartic protease [Sulfurimicrobium sp.]|jgi:aspartyl protease family protein|nr:TIGR02281 family clan AA aspartic protease [Sulfurimicrobium sp.]MDP2961628.1 TIGR02281 family clan AA aspartic protease [Sulfurimicrobium sp.]MDZ7657562.1 TIGR02281 family clan AA aspartic protease [Sulfurimicrobium sp.]